MDFKQRVAQSLASWEEKAPPGWEAGPTLRPPQAVGPSDGGRGAAEGAQRRDEPEFADLDPDFLVGLANATMPFGKHEGRLLLDLPEAYLLWFERQGFPDGLLGRRLQALLVIKANGMEVFLRPLVYKQ